MPSQLFLSEPDTTRLLLACLSLADQEQNANLLAGASPLDWDNVDDLSFEQGVTTLLG